MAANKQHHHQRDPTLGGLQCLSHFFNFIMLIVGSGATALGFLIYFTLRMNEERRRTLDIVGLMYYVVNLCPIAEGIFIVIVVLFGIIAICTMHRCSLIWYFSLVVIACVVSLMLTVMTFIVFFRLPTTIHDGLHDIVQNEYGLFGKEFSTQLMNDVQKSFSCCGSKSHDEWLSSEWYKAQRLGHFNSLDAPVHPESCCVMASEDIPANVTECVHINSQFPNQFINKQPCGEQIHEWLHWYTLFMGFAGIAVFLATLFEVGATSALLHALGPLRYENNPETGDKQRLTHVHSESETDTWSSSQYNSLGRPPDRKPPPPPTKRAQKKLRKVTKEDRDAKRKEIRQDKSKQLSNGTNKHGNGLSTGPSSVSGQLHNGTPTVVISHSPGTSIIGSQMQNGTGNGHTPGASSIGSYYSNGTTPKHGNGGLSSPGSDGSYVNTAFRHEAEEATTPL